MRAKAVQVLLIAGLAAGCGLWRGGAPPPVGSQLCIGVPQPTCRDLLQGRINERAPVQLVGYRVTCKVATCTAESGEAELALTWADGMTEVSSTTWMGPQ